eukprot:gene29639-9634_t
MQQLPAGRPSLCRACNNVARVCFADNFLDNTSVAQITDALASHPTCAHLDLSRNPISHAAGKTLSEFAGRNKPDPAPAAAPAAAAAAPTAAAAEVA